MPLPLFSLFALSSLSIQTYVTENVSVAKSVSLTLLSLSVRIQTGRPTAGHFSWLSWENPSNLILGKGWSFGGSLLEFLAVTVMPVRFCLVLKSVFFFVFFIQQL